MEQIESIRNIKHLDVVLSLLGEDITKMENLSIALVKWLAKPNYGREFYVSYLGGQLKKDFTVDWSIRSRARVLLEKWGFELKGERWEK